MYPDFNMHEFYGFDNFGFRGDFNYQNTNQQNTYNSEISYTLLMSIMTDELRHASKYNFLIHSAK